MNKMEVLTAIKLQIEQQLEAALAEAHAAKEAATNEESKAENKYDTRGLEASYIAGAQAKRAAQYKEDLYNLSKVNLENSMTSKVGSIVQVYYTEQEKVALYFLLPFGGISVQYQGHSIQSLSPTSPLGKALLNKKAADELIFRKEALEIEKVL